MTENMEERFREACSTYLLMAEQWDRAHGDAEAAQERLQRAQLDADRARDQLLQVVRERDAAAQLDAGRAVQQYSERVLAASAKWERDRPPPAGKVTWMTPQQGSQRWHDMIGQNICPECGVSWRDESPSCPKVQFDRHPR